MNKKHVQYIHPELIKEIVKFLDDGSIYKKCWDHVEKIVRDHSIKNIDLFDMSELVQELHNGKTIMVRDYGVLVLNTLQK